MAAPRTLFDKIWDSHVVHRQEDGTCVIYIDRHLVHEVTSPQAFEGLRLAGRKVRRPDAIVWPWCRPQRLRTGDRFPGHRSTEESRSSLRRWVQNLRDLVVRFPDGRQAQGIVHISA